MFAKNPSPVCPTVYEDGDEEHVVVRKAEKTHRPVTTTFAEVLRTRSRDELMALAAASSSSGVDTISRTPPSRRTVCAPPPPLPDEEEAD